MQLRDRIFLGMTQSLCPACLTLVLAKIPTLQGRQTARRKKPLPMAGSRS